MTEIQLGGGVVALVDLEDFGWLNQFKWYAHHQRKRVYAVRMIRTETGRRMIYMHRVILNTTEGMDSDHIDGNGLNNHKSNLRIVTRRQNCQNRHEKTSSKYPGVTYHKRNKTWQAQIQLKGKRIYLGCFPTEEEAFDAYTSREAASCLN